MYLLPSCSAENASILARRRSQGQTSLRHVSLQRCLVAPPSPEHGYREISVSDEPLRTEAAIVAALTALEGRSLDLSTLRKVLAIGLPLRGESFWDGWNRALEDRHAEAGLGRSLRELGHHQALDYVLMLLRYHQPGIDDLPRKDRTNLVVDACAYVNMLLEALRKLVAFLEHGRANCRGPSIVISCELPLYGVLGSCASPCNPLILEFVVQRG